MEKKLLLVFALVIFVIPALSVSISTYPSYVEFEDVEKGQTYENQIFLGVDNLGDNATLDLEITPVTYGPNQLFSNPNFEQERISEEVIGDWWSFDTNVTPESASFSPEGTSRRFEGVLNIELDVPDDADSGLRYGYLKISPAVNNTDIGGLAGAGVNTGRKMGYTVDIQGNVQRDIRVRRVRAFRLDENRAAVEVLLRNEGTVTTSTEDFQIEVLDSGRSEEAVLTASGVKIEPGQSRWVEASWESEGEIEEGQYQINGQVDFLTGQAVASGSFTLPGFNVVEVRPDDSPAVDGEEQQDTVPLWLVFMVLVIMAVLMWSFDIEPFWIMAIVGGLAISAFILLSGVSNYLLVVLLMAVGIVVYGVM